MNNSPIIQPEGNYYPKYTSENFLVKKIMGGFFSSINSLIRTIPFSSMLDVGCGEGFISSYISQNYLVTIDAFDSSEKTIMEAKKAFPNINFFVESIYTNKIKSGTYDLVICMEVLEHLHDPDEGLSELFRLTKDYVLVSVPNEPIWRISNMIRGKYLRNFGNTPGHINHWSKGQFISLCSTYGKIIKQENPFPWTMLMLKKN